jgi:hypothetical protein
MARRSPRVVATRGMRGAGGVTGGLAVQLAVARGATVVATAGPSSAARVRGWARGSWSTITIRSGRSACGAHLQVGVASGPP